MDSLKFIIAELPPGINQFRRLEYHAYGRERDRWQILVRQAIGRYMVSFPGQVAIQYTAYRVQLMDKDNFHGSFKLIGDALKNLKIIQDDGPRVVDEERSHYQQHRIPYRSCQRVEVLVEDLEEQLRGKRDGRLFCGSCGGEIDPALPYRRSRHGRVMHPACYSQVNALLKRKGLGPLNMTLIEPEQRRIDEAS